MSKESEWAESVIRADYHQPHLRKRRTERCHLTISLSIAPAVEVNEDWAVRISLNVGRPDIQVQTIFFSLNIREPSRRELRAWRTEIVGLARSIPFGRRVG